MTFAPKHVVMMVTAVCAAIVLAPVGVMAATGSLVNIADPNSSGRVARVSTDGALRVESRAAANTRTFNRLSSAMAANNFEALYAIDAPYRIAITDISVSADTGITGTQNQSYSTRLEIWSYVRKSGTGACGGSGWAGSLLRVVAVKGGETVQLTFDGSPLLLPAVAVGQRSCVAVDVRTHPTDTVVYAGVAGYTVAL